MITLEQSEEMSRRARKYTMNRSFFHDIDTEAKAYWLGFIAADGNIDKNLTHLCISLSRRDQDHLQLLLNAMESNHPIHLSNNTQGYPTASIYLGCVRMAQDLNRHGIVPRKTYHLQWPTLREDLYRHYVRGYIDGDGCFSATQQVTTKGNETRWSLTVIGTIQHITAMQSYLMQHCDLRKTKLLHPKNSVGSITTFVYTGRLQVERIANFLYTDATIWLPRKRDILEKYADRAYRTTLSQPLIDKMCQWYQEGKHSPWIASMIGLSHQTVLRTIRLAGVPTRPRGGRHN
jgi:hypothetical protein